MERIERIPPPLVVATVFALAAAMTLVLTSGMTFYQDTWAFLMTRRDLSADALFLPHNDHLVVFPALIEMALIRLFGMSSALPEYLLLTVFLLVTGLLLYVYMRRRVGTWLALLGVIVVFCLGPAWETLLWPFEITFLGPILFGLAMLLALEREDRRGDLAACAFLVLAVGFSGVGLCFIPAAAVAVFRGPRETWLGRAYIFAVPLLLYGAWWVGWGHDAESHLTLHNVLVSPHFVFDSVAFSLQSLLGLGPPVHGFPDVSWGRALTVAAVLGLAYRQVRVRPAVDRGFWLILTAALANWLLTAFNAFPGRDPSASRYQYAGVIFVLMIGANLFAGIRPGRKVLIGAAVVTLVAIAPNLVDLKQGRDVLRPQSVLTRADTGAIEIARRTVDPEFTLSDPISGTPSLINISAGEYLQAVDEYGSPAYSPAELAEAPEEGRRQADIVLSQALPLETEVRRGAFGPESAAENCVSIPGGGSAVPAVAVPAGATRIEVAPGPHADFTLSRFAVGEFPVPTQGAPGGSVTVLRIPRDASRRPWHLHVAAEQRARVCR